MRYINIYLVLILLFMSANASSQSKADNMQLFLVGTYTENSAQGVNLVSFHPDQKTFHIESVIGEVKNPSYVITNAENTIAYAVEEDESERGGKVTSFSIDKSSNQLTKINSVYSEGNGPCYLTLDPSEGFLLVGNYGGGNLSVIPVQSNGELMPATQTIQHTGSSVNKERQNDPHVHSVVFHPIQNQVFVADLGTDHVNIYDFNPDSNLPLTPSLISSLKVKPGSGPRHLVFNENGDHLYLIHEMKGEVGFYSKRNNQYHHVATYSLADDDFQRDHGGAEIRISKDYKFLYASNRGDAHNISVFAIDKGNGELELIQRVSSGGKTPRNFNISPDGEIIIVANQGSHNLTLFKRDLITGKLEQTDNQIEIHKPVYIHFFN